MVLVVEDEDAMRECAVDAIAERGFCVNGFVSADAAVEFLELHAQEVGAIFTDVCLPGQLDGVGLAMLVQEKWPGIQILVTSGDERIGPTLPTGAEFLLKPWRIADVCRHLDPLLSLDQH